MAEPVQPPGGALLDMLHRHGWQEPGVRDDVLGRVAMANDASHYLLTPEAIVVAETAEGVSRLMAAASHGAVPLTFRAGGTSLSGQAVTDTILVDTRRGFRGVDVLDEGRTVRVQPGTTVRAVNTALRPYGTRLGPDPASEGACTIGGVIANNSSGMTCGTHANSYRTLRSLRFVLPSGTLVDTADSDADERLAALEPGLHQGLLRLRDRVRADPRMVSAIEAQFSLKNTMGYGVNSLLDFDSPTDILAHLIVGSEGTLAFIASATFATVPLLPHASTGLLLLPDLWSATEALPALVDSGAAAIELLDERALRVAATDPHATGALRRLPLAARAALLVEYQAARSEELRDLTAGATSRFSWSTGDPLTTDPGRRAALWTIRKGLYAAVAGARKPGTTALLEDIAVPVDVLPDTCAELTRLLDKHGYDNSVIFGHAKDGNIHFMLVEDFGGTEGVDRYARFTEDMADLVLAHGGTLKAEHGTGRVMAGFVRRQYGEELYDVMRTIKQLCDPQGILNPGVLLTEDDHAHLRHLKTTAPIEPEADRCVECGFCEPVCPSQDLTMTPRQRIVARRAMSAAAQTGDTRTLDTLGAAFDYDGMQTCAADGMCQTACPVGIDTGALVRRLRADSHGRAPQALGRAAARHWDAATTVASSMLDASSRLPATSASASRLARKVLGEDRVPLWSSDLPRGGRKRTSIAAGPHHDLVFFPSCTGTIFGTDDHSTTEAFLSLCSKASIRVTVPDNIAGLCCGTPWSSKGLTDGAELMRRRLRDSLWRATREGRLPIVVDASSCAEGVHTSLESLGLRVEDAVQFAAREVLPRVDIDRDIEMLAVHPTCSSLSMGSDAGLLTVAEALSPDIFVPPSWGCCGFAGDRGLLHPELTESATRVQAGEILASAATTHVSCNRTCELAMTRAVGRTYRHILQVLDARSRPAIRRN